MCAVFGINCGMNTNHEQSPDEPFDIIDDTDRVPELSPAIDDAMAGDDEHLSGLRIRAVSAEKQALYRHRSYMLVLAGTCAVGAVQCVWLAVHRAMSLRQVSYVLVAVVLTWLCRKFFMHAQRYRQEAERTLLENPDTTPDFSTLSNGQQFARHLDELTRREQ